MEKFESYLLHSTGVYSMLFWLSEQQQAGIKSNISEPYIYAGDIGSKFFGLGISKSKFYSKLPFLAIQPMENKWFQLIQWEHVIVKKNDLNIYFTSKHLSGDGFTYPDIPSFVFVLSVDNEEKINLLRSANVLDGREIKKNELGIIHIDLLTKIFSLPIFKKDENELIIQPFNYSSFSDILKNNEMSLVNKYHNVPEFKGDEKIAKQAFEERESLLNKIIKKWGDI